MTPLELKVHRKNTHHFILADPVNVVLIPHVRVPKDSGGWRLEQAEPREPQAVRLLPTDDTEPELKSSSGRLAVPKYTLLADWDSPVQQWDRFVLSGVEYEVASHISPKHSVESVYERKAKVVVYSNA